MTDKNTKNPACPRVWMSEGRPACLASRALAQVGFSGLWKRVCVLCFPFSWKQTERACLHRVHFATLKVVSETIHDKPPEYNSEHKQKAQSAPRSTNIHKDSTSFFLPPSPQAKFFNSLEEKNTQSNTFIHSSGKCGPRNNDLLWLIFHLSAPSKQLTEVLWRKCWPKHFIFSAGVTGHMPFCAAREWFYLFIYSTPSKLQTLDSFPALSCRRLRQRLALGKRWLESV